MHQMYEYDTADMLPLRRAGFLERVFPRSQRLSDPLRIQLARLERAAHEQAIAPKVAA